LFGTTATDQTSRDVFADLSLTDNAGFSGGNFYLAPAQGLGSDQRVITSG